GRLAAHLVGAGVALMDEVPVRLAQMPTLAPFELDALPGHLLAFLAQLLALARAQRIQEVLEIPVTAIEPVELAAQALQPAGAAGQQGVVRGSGEVDMPAGLALLRQARLGLIQQRRQRRRRAQQAWPRHGSEG